MHKYKMVFNLVQKSYLFNFLNKNSIGLHSSRINCKKKIRKMKLCYISNFNQVTHQTKIKIVFRTKNYNDNNIKYYIKVGKSKDKTFFYMNKLNWPS